jgi:beta-glucosidase
LEPRYCNTHESHGGLAVFRLEEDTNDKVTDKTTTILNRMRVKSFFCIYTLLVWCPLVFSQEGEALLPFQNPGLVTEKRIDDLMNRLTLDEQISFLMNNNPAIPRLGIRPYDWWNEGAHGVSRSGIATVFPQSIALAATFDTSLVRRVGSTIADEARAKYNIAQEMGNYGPYAGLSFWSPNINIFRDPRWGRGQETYGEDPFLTGKTAVAFSKGMQGSHPVYIKVAVCAKHYAAHSGPENGRTNMNAVPPVKDLYETYLPAFKMLLQEGKAEMVMCAYSKLYDQPCCGSKMLLTGILRDKWGFTGHVVTDCSAITGFHASSKVTRGPVESAALALNSGVDMSCGDEYQYLREALERKMITRKTIQDKVRNVLRSRFKLGLFDPPGVCPYDTLNEKHINTPVNRALAREAAQKAIVLLKNKNNVLPLDKNARRFYIIGPNAATIESLLGSYYGTNNDMRTILEGVNDKISFGTSMEYKYAFTPDMDPVNPLHWWHCQQMNKADVIIVCAGLTGLMEGEEGETILTRDNGDRSDITLPPSQINFLKRIREQGNKPIVLIMNSGSPVALGEAGEIADAVIFAWYPGEEGGNAVADILFGDCNPSGRLPFTVPKSIQQLPPFADYAMHNRTYRYMQDEPEFPFGFGLSYTTFTYSNMKVSSPKIKAGESLTVTVDVANTGKMDGNEIVQLYLTQESDTLELPKYSLKGFTSLHIKSGESKKVTFTITPGMFQQVNHKGDAIYLPGQVKIFVGGASPHPVVTGKGGSKPQEGEVILEI